MKLFNFAWLVIFASISSARPTATGGRVRLSGFEDFYNGVEGYFHSIDMWSNNVDVVAEAAMRVKKAATEGNHGDMFFFYNLVLFNGQPEPMALVEHGDLELELSKAVEIHGHAYLHSMRQSTTIPEFGDWLHKYLNGEYTLGVEKSSIQVIIG